jgi:ABC-type multidrug transport system ATPase subunit
MVLDEPTDGLDPVWIAELRTLIDEWRAADSKRSLILASHNLPEVERLTEQVLLLHNGRLVDDFRYDAVRADLEDRFLQQVEALGEGRA